MMLFSFSHISAVRAKKRKRIFSRISRLLRTHLIMKDVRAALFSANSPIRIGTSGYSYKRFVHMDLSLLLSLLIHSFSWHSSQKYYPDKNEFNYYCGVGIRSREYVSSKFGLGIRYSRSQFDLLSYPIGFNISKLGEESSTILFFVYSQSE